MGRLTVRRRRRALGKHRLLKPQWRDPYPWIPGTVPEKMIFAFLVQNNFFFVYQDNLPEYRLALSTGGVFIPRYVPDFVLPEYKVIIDPFGDYHHSLPDVAASDARKAVIYAQLGYEFIHPWTSQIEKNGAAWVLHKSKRLWQPPIATLGPEDLPFRAQGYRLGPYLGLGSTSVAAANKKRAKPKQVVMKVRRSRRSRKIG